MAKKKGNLYKYPIDLKNSKGWTPVQNKLMNAKVEPKLTPEEFLVHCVIKSKPDDWSVNQEELKKTTGLSKGKFEKAIKGLKEKKLLKIPPSNDTGKRTYTYYIYDEPYQDLDSAYTENQGIENQDIDIKGLKSRSSDQTTDIEVHTNTNNKNSITKTNEKEGKEKYRKDSDISISSTLEKVNAIGIVCANLEKICSRLKPLEEYNLLDTINTVCDNENDSTRLKQALCDYLNSQAERGKVITPTSFKKLRNKLNRICSNEDEKCISVDYSTERAYPDFYQVPKNNKQKAPQARSYRKPERMMNKETGPKDHTRKESEEENG